jgi:hypothetical protein
MIVSFVHAYTGAGARVRLQPQQRSTHLSKRTILFLSIAAILLFIVGGVSFGVSAGSIASCAGTGATTISQDCAAQGGTPALIGFALLGLGGICSLIAFIGGLIKTAQIGAWVWFVLILLFTPLATLIYGIAGPETRQMAAPY